MKRALVIAVCASGCGVDCGPPSQIDGTYAVFANAVTWDGTNLEEFPYATSPANGWSEWSIVWDSVTGAMTVLIDDDAFDAGGSWNTIECGVFTLDFGGPYRDGPDLHAFDATGEFAVFADHLEGSWEYQEDWTTGQGPQAAAGMFECVGNISGTRIGEPFSE